MNFTHNIGDSMSCYLRYFVVSSNSQAEQKHKWKFKFCYAGALNGSRFQQKHCEPIVAGWEADCLSGNYRAKVKK